MRFRNTYLKITEAILKHPTKEEGDARLDSYEAKYGLNLMDAVETGGVEIVRRLLYKGADVNNDRNIGGDTALMHAVAYGFTDIAKLLLEWGAYMNARNNYGETALMWASRGGHIDTVKLLLDKGADVNAKDIYGKNALRCALARRFNNIAELLKQHGANEKTKA